MSKSGVLCGVAVLGCVLGTSEAWAQPLGTFRWQQTPYCNVITVNVVQVGAIYHLDGTDNQCDAARQAAVTGLGFVNPNGTIGLGLTIVTNDGGGNGGAPLHLDVILDLSASGTWRDNTGISGPFTLLVGPPAAGSPRPAPVPAFTGGLAAGGARITNVGTPSAGTDATNKNYVDAGQAALRAQLFRQLVMPGEVAFSGAKLSTGPFTSSRSSLGVYVVSYNLAGLDIPQSLAPPVIVATPVHFCTGGSVQASWSSYSVNLPFLTSFTVVARVTNAAGNPVDCGFNFLITLQPPAALPPVSDTPPPANDVGTSVTCVRTEHGPVCK